MITDGHYISFWLTKHGHQCGIASLLTGQAGEAEVSLMIKVHASGYIWTNLEFEYPLKGVSFESHVHNVNHLVKTFFFLITSYVFSVVQSESILHSGILLYGRIISIEF